MSKNIKVNDEIISRLLDSTQLRTRFALSGEEIDTLRAFGKVAKPEIPGFLTDFYEWLPGLSEYRVFFDGDTNMAGIRTQQTMHWEVFFDAQINQEFIRARHVVGNTHSRIGLPINSFVAGMNFSIEWWFRNFERLCPKELDIKVVEVAFRKMCAVDLTIVTEAYSQITTDKVKASLKDTNLILDNVTVVSEAIAQGDFSKSYSAVSQQDERLAEAINKMLGNLKGVVGQAKTIADGDYSSEVAPLSDKDELGTALFDMTKTLREMTTKNSQEAWVKTGQAELSDLMRGEQNIHELSRGIISYLAKYLGALMGTLYQTQEGEKLRLVGSFAHHHRKGNQNEIDYGSGLVGQCAIEKESIIFSEVPEDYISINSSLGSTVPKSVIVVPVMLEGIVYGVLEFGAPKPFVEKHMELLNQVTENVAIALKSAVDREKMKILLDDSKKQAAEMQAQQEELRCTNEEMQSQQDKLQTSNTDLEDKAIELRASQTSIQKQNDALEAQKRLLVDQKKAIEQQNREVEKSRLAIEAKAKELEVASKYKSEFLANMSHELRTPLNSLLILAESLADNDEGNLNDEEVEAAQIIHSGGNDLLNLINDILDLSKVEAGKLEMIEEDVELAEVLNNLHRQFKAVASKKGLDFKIDHRLAEGFTLRSDSNRLEQILKNFLSNAFKFTEKGCVTLTLQNPSGDEIFRNQDLDSNNSIALSVDDTGIGIPEDKQAAIFEAFQQADGSTSRQYGGTGLGLSISRELAKLLGCEIHLKSTPGKGSSFILYMPMGQSISTPTKSAPKAPVKKKVFQQERAPSAPTPNVSAKRQVLVVEDNATSQKAIAKVTGKENIAITEAKDAKGALEALQAGSFDAMILDLGLPDMNGMALLKKVSELSISIPPVVVYTGRDMTKEEYAALNEYTESFVLKGANSSDRLKEELRLCFANPAKSPLSPLQAAPKPLPKSSKKKSAGHAAIGALKGKTVLLVDDDLRNTFALSGALRKKGLKVVMADNGKMAIEKLQAEPAVELVIMDIMMPIMNGYEAMTAIRGMPKYIDLPMIALTAKVLPEDRQKAFESGASDFLTKPVNVPALVKAIEGWIVPPQTQSTQETHA